MSRLLNFRSAEVPITRSLSDQKVLVVGLGRFGGGVGVTRWLARKGAIVTVTDQADAESLAESIDALKDLSIEYRLGGHDPGDLERASLVVVNPAIDKRRSEFFRAIVDSGVAWTTEMNLFCERCPASVVGVTGSFGKSTTSAMIAEGLRAAISGRHAPFRRVYLGGNIGRSLLDDLDEMDNSDIVVLEMSNAQLEDTPRIGWAPAAAVITNIQPHHLDRYESFAGYVDAKLNILAPCAPSERRRAGAAHPQDVILGPLYPDAHEAFQERADAVAHRLTRVLPDDERKFSLAVPGVHNQQNARLAAATLEMIGIDATVTREALGQFRGLPHRLEFVVAIDGVDFINDSKSTSPAATVVAVEAMEDRPLIVIVGGKRKEGVHYEACASVLARRCRAAVCMGECGAEFAQALSRALSGKQSCLVERATTLESALVHARHHARTGDTILLSPGAASFDAYANYEKRGEHFMRLARAIPNTTRS